MATKPPSIYLESRYRKLMRGLPQTIYYCPVCKGDRRRKRRCENCAGRGKLTDDSVQEIIGRVALPGFRARTGRFHGAGREDIDVRMLGRGRPFVYEVVGPRQQLDLAELDDRIRERAAGRIELAPFVAVDRARIVYWKTGQFDKLYRARVGLDGVPSKDPAGLVGRELSVTQRTPERVAHRRADLARERQVAVVEITPGTGAELEIVVRTSHGTYVKEWISGEGGRTDGSLASELGIGCRCVELDVLEIVTEGQPNP